MENIFPIICLRWEESELDWGITSDGYSFHLTVEDAQNFVKEYWDSMPDEVPAVYSRPSGKAYTVSVPFELMQEIKESKYGIRRYTMPEGVRRA